ncbi:biotin transporter BioY [Lactococcus allomyrinae]|uniref:Biotin transporter n=1 Tax=Lactococcus allomyrinae TaxID=2419773 RepID=A0A387BHD6_9LACT|nr:biotin transporter BioY [Lactococcus allomyrinae]AYG00437.1 biotin transporter BioY [Lactococcus allomyrinae]
MTNNQKIKVITFSAMMTTFIIVLGFFPAIPLGFIPVPIVLQNMGVMMSGGLLGPKYGTISVGLFLLLAFIGLPILTGGNGGAASFMGPTGGYLIAWLFTPLLIGLLLRRIQALHLNSWWWELIVVVVAGIIFVDVAGALWLSWQSHLPLFTALSSNLVFIPGDFIKAVLSVMITRRLRRSLGFDDMFILSKF